jgi:TonB family protein
VAREQGEQWSESSVEYGEEIRRPSDQARQGAEEQEQQDTASLFSDEELGRIDSGDAAGEAGTGDKQTGAAQGDTEEAAETGQAAGGGPGGASGGAAAGSVNVQFDQEGIRRKLLETEEPKLTAEELAELPREIAVRIGFTLNASGRLTDLNIVAGSGHTQVDNKVKAAVRQWRFESAAAAGQGPEPVNGTITLILRKN